MTDAFGHRFDALTLDEIVSNALEAEDWGEAIQLASAAGRKSAKELLDYALTLLSSTDRHARHVGLLLAGEVKGRGLDDRAEGAIAPFLAHADPRLVSQAILALGALGRYSRPEYIRAGSDHPEFAVRWARNMALQTCAWGHDGPRKEPDSAACAALIEVSRDPRAGRLADSAVADLMLIFQQGLGTPEVEECLRWHAENGTPDARETAALALRGDGG